MPERLTISTGARLHFGPLAVRAEHGPDFGGLGLMVDRPGWVVCMERSDRDVVSAGPETERIAGILNDCRSRSPHGAEPVDIKIQRTIPSHAGFGSGTQLALAIGRGLAVLNQEPDLSAVELARHTGRGRRSAIGIHGFELGGLIVDAGHRAHDGVGDLACRMAVPADWRFVLVTPPCQGLSGKQELAAFEQLPPMPASLTDRLCRLVLCDVLPAIQHVDFTRFSAAVSEYGTLVGRYFAPVQGGVFVDPRMQALAEQLGARFRLGCAQTSWGPSVAVFCPDHEAAEAVAQFVRGEPRRQDCTVTIAAALNRGAKCEVHADAPGSARGAG
jgi:beta-RFAP synthase